VSVYVDNLNEWGWRLGPSCHLVADGLDELHDFAARLGLKRLWFQGNASTPHYDLTARRRAKALTMGAIELGRHDFVVKCRAFRALCRAVKADPAQG
jgi:hypothetical protein